MHIGHQTFNIELGHKFSYTFFKILKISTWYIPLFLAFVLPIVSWGDSPYGVTCVGTVVSGCDSGAYDYNAAGSRLRNAAPGHLQTIGYGLLGKPVQISNREGGVEGFQYGVGGQRYLRRHPKDNGTTEKTFYVGDSEYRIAPDGSVKHIVYIRNGDYTPIAQVDISNAAVPTYRYHLNDHQGSPLRTVNDAGAAQAPQRYDPWGLTTGPAGVFVEPDDEDRGYTGHEVLASSRLLHMNGRVFEPDTALFVSPDPVVQEPNNLADLNRYSLVRNSPVNGTDPSGYTFVIKITAQSERNAANHHDIDYPLRFAVDKLNALDSLNKGVLRALIRKDSMHSLYASYYTSNNKLIVRNNINLAKLKPNNFYKVYNIKDISLTVEETRSLIPAANETVMFDAEFLGLGMSGRYTFASYNIVERQTSLLGGLDLANSQIVGGMDLVQRESRAGAILPSDASNASHDAIVLGDNVSVATPAAVVGDVARAHGASFDSAESSNTFDHRPFHPLDSPGSHDAHPRGRGHSFDSTGSTSSFFGLERASKRTRL